VTQPRSLERRLSKALPRVGPSGHVRLDRVGDADNVADLGAELEEGQELWSGALPKRHDRCIFGATTQEPLLRRSLSQPCRQARARGRSCPSPGGPRRRGTTPGPGEYHRPARPPGARPPRSSRAGPGASAWRLRAVASQQAEGAAEAVRTLSHVRSRSVVASCCVLAATSGDSGITQPTLPVDAQRPDNESGVPAYARHDASSTDPEKRWNPSDRQRSNQAREPLVT
jgi:hypothetical protein